MILFPEVVTVVGTKIAIVQIKDQSEEGVYVHLQRHTPGDTLAKLFDKAKPWKEILTDWVEKRNDSAVVELLLGLQAYKHDKRMLRGLSPRLDSFLETEPDRTVLDFGSGTFIEEGGCTYYARCKQGRHSKKKRILNALLRIEFKICVEGNDSYHGRLIFAGHEVLVAFPAIALLSVTSWRRHGQPTLRSAIRKVCGKHLVADDIKCFRLAEVLVVEMEQSCA